MPLKVKFSRGPDFFYSAAEFFCRTWPESFARVCNTEQCLHIGLRLDWILLVIRLSFNLNTSLILLFFSNFPFNYCPCSYWTRWPSSGSSCQDSLCGRSNLFYTVGITATIMCMCNRILLVHKLIE